MSGAAAGEGGLPWSAWVCGVVAALVGFGGALPVVLEAMVAVGARGGEAVSWVTGLCIAMAATTAILSVWHRMPIVTAWSTPGAALIAATSGIGIGQAAGAFVVAGGLIVLTAALTPLARLVARIPTPIAAGMLAGVLLKFAVAMAQSAVTAPILVLPLIVLFFLARQVSPAWSVIAVLAVGSVLSVGLGLTKPIPGSLAPGSIVWIAPVFDPAVIIGLAVPLYLVTMASQNLAGAAVLKAAGYSAPLPSILAVTGLASMATAPFGAHTSNLAAISAAICTGPDCHPSPARRWHAGPAYALSYGVLAILGGSVIAVFTALPVELVRTLAGLALLPALVGALHGATADERVRLPAALSFAVTASGLSVLGVGAAFWGLVAGLAAYAIELAFAGLARK